MFEIDVGQQAKIDRVSSHPNIKLFMEQYSWNIQIHMRMVKTKECTLLNEMVHKSD